MESSALYLVFVEPDAGRIDLPGIRRLGSGLYLAATPRTRSQLYHAVKRRTVPRRLLVAPLADAPKFKGMEPGALAWLRGLEAGERIPGADDSPLLEAPPVSAAARPAGRKPARRRR